MSLLFQCVFQQRLICVAFDFQDFADLARESYPEIKDRIIQGHPGKYAYKDPGVYTLKNDKSKRVLGIECRFCLLLLTEETAEEL